MASPTLVEELSRFLGAGKVFTPEAPEYEGLIRRWADSAMRRAAIVVCPTSSRDVSEAVTLATKHHMPLAVCGGGHGTGAESSSEGGLVVDLRKMRATAVDKAKKTIALGGGCKWVDVDTATAEHGLATVGGTVNDTGVAGLTLGGGFGWLAGQLGIVLDRLVAAEVVLADGRIATCSATSEPDLFWAIRGAGHSFGVITQFVFQCVEKTEPIYGGVVFFPAMPATVKHVTNFANEVFARGNPRTAMMTGFTTVPGPEGPARVVLAACFHDGPTEEAEKIYEPLLKNGPMPPIVSTLTSMPYSAMNGILAAAAEPGGRHTSKGATFTPPLSADLVQKLLDGYNRLCEEVPEAGTGGVCLFEFYNNAKISSVGHAEMAFPNRGRYQNATISPHWLSEAHDGKMRAWAREAMQWVRESQDAAGQPTAEYMNYDSSGTAAEKVFGPNYPRLRALKARYDPHDVFSKRHGLGKDLPRKETVAEAKAEAVAEAPNAHRGKPVVNVEAKEVDGKATA